MDVDFLQEIERVLDEKVRPDMALHGGDIRIVKWENDILTVRLCGQCSGCPSADLTMESLVRTELLDAFPMIKNVVLMSGVSDAMIAEAKKILSERNKR